MRNSLLIAPIFSLLLFASVAHADDCYDDCQKDIVDKYFECLSEIYRKSSKIEEVDGLFSILSESVHYEHLNYGASFKRDEWKEAFLYNLNRGAYKNEDNQSLRVEKYIHGKGFVAVSYSYGITLENGLWKAKGDQNLLALFGISNGKITSVKEYW